MKTTTKKNIAEWTNLFICILEKNGFQKQDMAQGLGVTPRTISNWSKNGEKTYVPRKYTFIQLCTACVRIRSFELSNETIAGSSVAKILLGYDYIDPSDNTLSAVIKSFITRWIGNHSKENCFINSILANNQSDWEIILDLLRRNKKIIVGP